MTVGKDDCNEKALLLYYSDDEDEEVVKVDQSPAKDNQISKNDVQKNSFGDFGKDMMIEVRRSSNRRFLEWEVDEFPETDMRDLRPTVLNSRFGNSINFTGGMKKTKTVASCASPGQKIQLLKSCVSFPK